MDEEDLVGARARLNGRYGSGKTLKTSKKARVKRRRRSFQPGK